MSFFDLTDYVSDVQIGTSPDPHQRRYLSGLKDASITLDLTPEPPFECRVTGTYERCQLCGAEPDEPKANITKVTMRRDPNPAGAHLPTQEPIYITPHKLPCVYVPEEAK